MAGKSRASRRKSIPIRCLPTEPKLNLELSLSIQARGKAVASDSHNKRKDETATETATAGGSQTHGKRTRTLVDLLSTTEPLVETAPTHPRSEGGFKLDVALSLKPYAEPEIVGISCKKRNKLWGAHLRMAGVRLSRHQNSDMRIFLGLFSSVAEAQSAHDKAALKLYHTRGGNKPSLNFPGSAWHAEYLEEHKTWTFRDCVWKIRRSSERFTKGTSSFKGVCVVKSNCGHVKYRAHITKGAGLRKKKYNVGTFEREEEAAQAYDLVLLFLHREVSEEELLLVITNFRPSEYTNDQIICAGQEYNIV